MFFTLGLVLILKAWPFWSLSWMHRVLSMASPLWLQQSLVCYHFTQLSALQWLFSVRPQSPTQLMYRLNVVNVLSQPLKENPMQTFGVPLFSFILHCKFQPQILISTSSALWICCFLSFTSLYHIGKVPPGRKLEQIGGGRRGAVNLVFPFSQKSGLWYLLPNVWQTVALYILFYFIVFEDGKGGFVWYQLLHWTRSGSSRIFFWGRVISLNWVLLLSDQLKSEKSLMVLWI